MSFQAYLDAIEQKTGLTPRQLLTQAHERGFDETTKAAPILAWLAEDHGLGRGHGMAMVHVITKGAQISSAHVGTTGTHRDASDTLWLDGRATRPV
ncbi:DUF4287 domain-containing protein [Cellulomonas sp. zg-ZUI222]|uniref:DUF4287 domain-containing protein n=1 Tax=Cellulomonas wangleii TaxID=2816956 RepID=UPI001A945E08|nr:DUF4287 domain-containing protein [Cellulomonas wangleii]MBO0919950.1 DUF4287 domain-containing protein [Cellulomonas wangleii]